MTNIMMQATRGRKAWTKASYDLCVHLAQARQHFSNENEFGKWCENNGFGVTALNKEERVAAVAMGKNPVALRACLNTATTFSLDVIYRYNFPRFQ